MLVFIVLGLFFALAMFVVVDMVKTHVYNKILFEDISNKKPERMKIEYNLCPGTNRKIDLFEDEVTNPAWFMPPLELQFVKLQGIYVFHNGFAETFPKNRCAIELVEKTEVEIGLTFIMN